jgi:hypothetical protein
MIADASVSLAYSRRDQLVPVSAASLLRFYNPPGHQLLLVCPGLTVTGSVVPVVLSSGPPSWPFLKRSSLRALVVYVQYEKLTLLMNI